MNLKELSELSERIPNERGRENWLAFMNSNPLGFTNEETSVNQSRRGYLRMKIRKAVRGGQMERAFGRMALRLLSCGHWEDYLSNVQKLVADLGR